MPNSAVQYFMQSRIPTKCNFCNYGVVGERQLLIWGKVVEAKPGHFVGCPDADDPRILVLFNSHALQAKELQ